MAAFLFGDVENNGGWKTLSSITHFSDDHLAVLSERVGTPTREQGRDWTVVRRKPAVVIAAMTAAEKFVFIHQERIPIRECIWEMPAGQVDEVCEAGSLKDVARRELREETGYDLAPEGEIIPLGDFFSSPGFTDEREFLFLARSVRPTSAGHSHGDGESIVDCREFSAAEITEMIADGAIRDANTLSAWARLRARGIVK